MIKVAINGFGRIGRLCFRLMEENEEFEVVAINDLTDAEQLAYLLKYDTNHRNYRIDEISNDEDEIVIGSRRVKVYAEKEVTNPTRIVTSSVRVKGGDRVSVSCKTKSDIPKSKIFDVARALRDVEAQAPVAIGDVLLEDVAGTGVQIVATSHADLA